MNYIIEKIHSVLDWFFESDVMRLEHNPSELEIFLVKLFSSLHTDADITTTNPYFSAIKQAVFDNNYDAYIEAFEKLDQVYVLSIEERHLLLHLKNKFYDTD